MPIKFASAAIYGNNFSAKLFRKHAGRFVRQGSLTLKKIVLFASILFGLFACATAQTVSEAPLSAGVSKSFPASFDAVSGATLKALTTMNVSVKSTEKKPEGLVVLVSKAMSAFSWGEVGRIVVANSGAGPTKVHVLWEKRHQLQITGTGQDEFSESLFKAVSGALPKS